MRRTPLKRYARLRSRSKTSKHARRPRDLAYMAFVHTLPCIARLLPATGHGCDGPIHAHHMRGRYIADADRSCVPLCRKHHDDWHGRVGGNGIFEGWGKERRHQWAVWTVATTQLAHAEGRLLGAVVDDTQEGNNGR